MWRGDQGDSVHHKSEAEPEWDEQCQLAPDTPDGFYTDYDPIIEYEVCDLVPGTSDGFPDYNVDPIYLDSS